jgi:hypothetical protein
MHEYSKADIDHQKSVFERLYIKKTAIVNEHTFTYFIVPQSKNPELPNFALRITGKPEYGYVIGVSDNIKISFQPYVAFHEFYEFLILEPETKERCLKALEAELKSVPNDFKPEYTKMRIEFFENLISYADSNRKNFSDSDIAEFQRSLSHLEKLAQ